MPPRAECTMLPRPSPRISPTPQPSSSPPCEKLQQNCNRRPLTRYSRLAVSRTSLKNSDAHIHTITSNLIACSFHQEVLARSCVPLVVEGHFLPGEVEGGGHALVAGLGEGGPGEGGEPAVAGGGAGDHPVMVGCLCLGGDDLAVDDSEGLGVVLVEVFPGGDAFAHVFFLVDEHPVLDVLCGCHLGVEFPEDPGPGVVFKIVGVCIGGGVHCW